MDYFDKELVNNVNKLGKEIFNDECEIVPLDIFGKLLKGPKLTKLSPNKTYAGVFGSFLLSIMITTLFFELTLKIHDFRFTIQTFIFVLVISLVSQIGDIIISYFKRLSKIKDTGKIIPGHGGLLDRIDGMIFAFPFSYILLFNSYFKIFT